MTKGLRRSPFETKIAILKTAHENPYSLFTHLLAKANLNCNVAQPTITKMLETGLLQKIPKPTTHRRKTKKQVYIITKLGTHVLVIAQVLDRMLEGKQMLSRCPFDIDEMKESLQYAAENPRDI